MVSSIYMGTIIVLLFVIFMLSINALGTYPEAISCFELIATNVQRSTLDFSCLKKLFDDVESTLQALESTSDDQFTLASLRSLLNLVNVHRDFVRVLQNNSYPTSSAGSARWEGTCSRGAERRSAVESMKLAFTNVGSSIGLTAIVGSEEAKNVLREACIFPLCYPHLFQGSVRPWRRILLFGPPGTGKTLLAKGLAEELGFDVFCVSSSALFSAWIGESEKLIKELFETARKNSDVSLVFIDEIDSLCRQRTQTEDEHSRRTKTELLRQLEGMPSSEVTNDPFILAATNCPWDMDPAFLRRFQRRIYVGVPTREDRKTILKRGFAGAALNVTPKEWEKILDATEGFSGADLSHLINAAGMVPIREFHEVNCWKFTSITKNDGGEQNSAAQSTQMCNKILDFSEDMTRPRPVVFKDFLLALQSTPRTITPQLLKKYEDFKENY